MRHAAFIGSDSALMATPPIAGASSEVAAPPFAFRSAAWNEHLPRRGSCPVTKYQPDNTDIAMEFLRHRDGPVDTVVAGEVKLDASVIHGFTHKGGGLLSCRLAHDAAD